MIVFKNYFKIVKKNLGFIIMYSMIAIGIAVVNTNYKAEDTYTNVIPKISIINYDDSNLTRNFEKYMEENTTIIEVKDDTKEIQDALFSNKVDTILVIEKNYTKDLLSGKESKIEIKKSAQNMSTTTEMLVNKYFKLVYIYSSLDMSEEEIIKKVNEDINKSVKVKIESKENTKDNVKLAVFYSFENYAFISIFIFIICNIMCIFNKDVISKRNHVSKMKPKEFSKQLFLGHTCLTLCIWFIFILISILLYKDLMFSMHGLLLIVNSFIFTITITALAYFIGTLIKNQGVISGIQNILGLGSSFISGCFITIDILDPNIVNFSKIFPSYWFIKANYDIVKLDTINFETLKPILTCSLIVFAYGVLYFIASRITLKKGH